MLVWHTLWLFDVLLVVSMECISNQHHVFTTIRTVLCTLLISDAVPSIHRSIDQAWMDISSGLEVVLKFSGHRADGLLTLAQLFYQLFLLLLTFVRFPSSSRRKITTDGQAKARKQHINIHHSSIMHSFIDLSIPLDLTD